MNNIFIFDNYKLNIQNIFKNLLLLHSTNGKNCKIHILNYDNINEYISLPNNFNNLDDIIKLKFIKYSILYNFGGIWIDNNILLLKNIDFLFNFHNGFFIYHNNKLISNIIGSVPYNLLFKIFIDNINTDIDIIYNNFKFLFKKFKIIDETYFYNDIINNKYIYFDNSINTFDDSQKMLNYIVFNSIFSNSNEYFINDYNYCIYKNQPFIIFDNSILNNYDLHNDFFTNKLSINFFINKSFDNLTHLDNIDFIEIGSSHFETLIEECSNNDKGITIEPIKFYLDKLPHKINVKKLNLAISDKNGKADIYYISPDNIKKLNLPGWFYGCNSINDYHPYHINENLQKYVTIDKIDIIPTYQLFYSNKIKKVKYLKIDTEGHDCIILKSLFNYIKFLPKSFYPDVIFFEVEMTKDKIFVDFIINSYINIGYKLIKKSWDAILIL